MTHKAGFVNIIGNPNVGKSTLMNALIGEQLSIISQKAQTTRHRIIGLLNDENYQVVFSDTPGMVNPHDKLQASMMNVISDAVLDADIFLLLTEVKDDFKNQSVIEKIKRENKPILLLINKIDLSTQDEVAQKIDYWKNEIPMAHILPVSALHGFQLEKVKDKILEFLPESPAYYSKEDISDRHMRFFVSEVIREKILKYYAKEIPYAVEVVVEDYKESPKIDRIRVIIFTERESQKIILIGQNGRAIKKMGSEARKDLERRLQKKVFLDLHVKVLKDWRDNDKILKQFGYE